MSIEGLTEESLLDGITELSKKINQNLSSLKIRTLSIMNDYILLGFVD